MWVCACFQEHPLELAQCPNCKQKKKDVDEPNKVRKEHKLSKMFLKEDEADQKNKDKAAVLSIKVEYNEDDMAGIEQGYSTDVKERERDNDDRKELNEDMAGIEQGYSTDVIERERDHADRKELNEVSSDFLEELTEVTQYNPKEIDEKLLNIQCEFEKKDHKKFLEKVEKIIEGEMRMVLIGRTGSGKSSTGNSILGRAKFESKISASSVTSTSSYNKAKIDEKVVVVVDTPGVFDTNISKEQTQKEIAKCIQITAPGPHAVLLVVEAGRFTPEVKSTLDHFIDHFGPELRKYVIVIFTRLDDIKREKKSFEQYIKTAPKDLEEFLKYCGGRCMGFDNTCEKTASKAQVKKLIEMVGIMIKENGGSCYTDKMYEQVALEIREKEIKLKEDIDRQDRKQKEYITKMVSDKFEREVKKYKQEMEDFKAEREKMSNVILNLTKQIIKIEQDDTLDKASKETKLNEYHEEKNKNCHLVMQKKQEMEKKGIEITDKKKMAEEELKTEIETLAVNNVKKIQGIPEKVRQGASFVFAFPLRLVKALGSKLFSSD